MASEETGSILAWLFSQSCFNVPFENGCCQKSLKSTVSFPEEKEAGRGTRKDDSVLYIYQYFCINSNSNIRETKELYREDFLNVSHRKAQLFTHFFTRMYSLTKGN